MKKILFIILSSLFTISCSKPGENANCINMDSPVSIDDVLEAYEKNDTTITIWDNPDVYKVLHSFAEIDTTSECEIEIFDTVPFNIELPEYRQSKHPFLSSAEDIYNSSSVAHNIWSNYEVWCRFAEENDNLVPKTISEIKLDFIRDLELKKAATDYKNGVVEMLLNPKSMDEDNNPSELFHTYLETINNKWHKFYSDPDPFYVIMNDYWEAKNSVVEDRFQTYLKADSEKRLGVMLKALSECTTFTEQCSLFCRWADCIESKDGDEWIIAVGTRMMDENHYCAFLHNVWLIWRSMCQWIYYGSSKDSDIPNRMYNEYRAKCYKACLKQILNHADDVLAMNSASVLAGRSNILRYGQYPFGNQNIVEMSMNLPERYKQILGDDSKEEK